MDLTFTVQKIKTTGEHKAVINIHYTVSGTDDNGKSASLHRVIPFPIKDGTEDGYVAFDDITQETAVAWVKSALTPTHLADVYVDDDGYMQGTATGIDLWSEVEQSIKADINSEIAKAETNLPWE